MPRFPYLAAPALLVAYGVARQIDGLDGSYGPGPTWTIGHVFFGVGLTMFGVVLIWNYCRPPEQSCCSDCSQPAGSPGTVV